MTDEDTRAYRTQARPHLICLTTHQKVAPTNDCRTLLIRVGKSLDDASYLPGLIYALARPKCRKLTIQNVGFGSKAVIRPRSAQYPLCAKSGRYIVILSTPSAIITRWLFRQPSSQSTAVCR
jgi:hypothetical protein